MLEQTVRLEMLEGERSRVGKRLCVGEAWSSLSKEQDVSFKMM